MEELGLIRVPFYPQLNIFNREGNACDSTAMVLSVLLFWHSKDKFIRFNKRQHSYLLARNLCITPDAVNDSLEYLTSLKILDKNEEVLKTNSDNPEKKEKLNEFYALNFHNLHLELKKRGLSIPVKVLRMASDDYEDFYSYISPQRLPKVQGLKGKIKGERYDEAALNICRILSGICSEKAYEEFSYRALAPGWRMLCQPPARAEDLVLRYQREGERSIDIDLMDGSFFIPDGHYFGTEKHHIWHTEKTDEPKILAGALYLCCTALSNGVEFYSDLSIKELEESFKLLYRFTGLKGRLSEVYFEYLDLTDSKLEQARHEYEEILSSLK